MDETYEIEPATLDDLDALEDRWVDLVESQREYGAHLLGESNRGKGRDVLAQYIASDKVAVARPSGARYSVGSDDILGFIMFYLEEGMYEQRVTRGIVENLYVIPEARESGIGSALMEYAEATLADLGAEVVAVSVMAENRMAREFYRGRAYSSHRVVFERKLPDSEE